MPLPSRSSPADARAISSYTSCERVSPSPSDELPKKLAKLPRMGAAMCCAASVPPFMMPSNHSSNSCEFSPSSPKICCTPSLPLKIDVNCPPRPAPRPYGAPPRPPPRPPPGPPLPFPLENSGVFHEVFTKNLTSLSTATLLIYFAMRGGPPPSVGRPCRTTTERQGVVDGALGPANDAHDGLAAQTPAGVAARDGQEGLGTTPSGIDCGLAAGLLEAELAAGERIFAVLDANNRRVRRNSPMMSSGTSPCRTHRGGTMRRPDCCCSLGSRAAQVYWLAKCHTHLASAIWLCRLRRRGIKPAMFINETPTGPFTLIPNCTTARNRRHQIGNQRKARRKQDHGHRQEEGSTSKIVHSAPGLKSGRTKTPPRIVPKLSP
eukprot:scaffold17523_cov98-Phaeocystis_antarctica.AAC.2